MYILRINLVCIDPEIPWVIYEGDFYCPLLGEYKHKSSDDRLFFLSTFICQLKTAGHYIRALVL
jgi:hypothetical protein